MTEKQTNSNEKNEKAKQILLETVKNQKPETNAQLITMVQQITQLIPQEIIQVLIELENEDKITFKKKDTDSHTVRKTYVFSKQVTWYWAIILLDLLTVAILFVPDSVYLIIYLRSALGIIFLLFLPGFSFIKAFFPSNLPIKTSSENLDNIERITLSIGLSLVFVPVVGLILNYTPWGIQLVPITLILLALTVVLSTIAVLREYKTKSRFPT